MLPAFYLSGAIAILATLLMVTRAHAIHALLYLVVSLMAVAVVFFTLGAPFVAALELIIYAGAIMVLFVFVMMMLNLGGWATQAERKLLPASIWPGPSLLSALLLAELIFLLARAGPMPQQAIGTTPREVALSLFGPYALGVELASFLMLAALVGAYHLGVQPRAAVAKGLR